MQDPVQEIKQKLAIEDVVAGYVQLKKAGRYLKAPCPFHDEKTPSFFVSPDKQIAYCFSCQKGGDLFAFIQEIEGLEFREALEFLADRAQVELPKFSGKPVVSRDEKDRLRAVNQDANKFFVQTLDSTEDGKKVQAYLKLRGMTDETIKTFEVGLAPQGRDLLYKHLLQKKHDKQDCLESTLCVSRDAESREVQDRFQLRLMFPIHDVQGNPVAFGGRALKRGDQPKYLNSPEYQLYHKGGTLYNLHQAKAHVRSEDLSVVVEGYFDVMASHQAGIPYVVASCGTALTEGQFKLLKRYSKRVALAFDSDAAGQAALLRAVKTAQPLEVELFVVTAPGGKDAADVVKEDPEAWVKAVVDRQHYLDFFFDYWTHTFDLDSVDGKREYSNHCLDLLLGVSHPVEQDHYLKLLSKKIGTPIDRLYDFLNQMRQSSRQPRSLRASDSKAPQLSPKERLIDHFHALILAKPDLLKGLVEESKEEAFVLSLKELTLNKPLTRLSSEGFRQFLTQLEEESSVYKQVIAEYNPGDLFEMNPDLKHKAFEAEVKFQDESLFKEELKKIFALLYLQLTP